MPATWRASLPVLHDPPASKARALPRVAILGVGNVQRSDDAAGMLVIRELARRTGGNEREGLLIVEGGSAPENRTAELRRFAPELVILVDAADMGEAPGTIRWIAEDEIDGMSASTHSLPLSMLAHYVTLECNCPVRILGIQATSNHVGERVCPEVMQAVREVVDEMDIVFR